MKKKKILIDFLCLAIGIMGCVGNAQILVRDSSNTKETQVNTTEEVKNSKKESVVLKKEKETPFLMDAPPFAYYLSDKVKVDKNQPLKLKPKYESTNQIIDEDNWFQNNDLKLNTYNLPDETNGDKGNLPSGIDIEYNDLKIVSAFYDSSYIYCVYGSDYSDGKLLQIYDSSNLNLLYFLDFSNYIYSPEYEESYYEFICQGIKWASLKNNILYIANAHITYAKNSHNRNGYITAIDLSDKSILWRSEALVQNSANFLIEGNVIICGYGFTDEPDYLYQLDISTGKIIDSIKLKTAPSFIIKKEILYILERIIQIMNTI